MKLLLPKLLLFGLPDRKLVLLLKLPLPPAVVEVKDVTNNSSVVLPPPEDLYGTYFENLMSSLAMPEVPELVEKLRSQSDVVVRRSQRELIHATQIKHWQQVLVRICEVLVVLLLLLMCFGIEVVSVGLQ